MRFAPAAALLTFFAAAALAQAPATPAPAAVPEPSLPYTVKPSDKLIRLSRDLLVTPGAWGEVAKFNQMKDPNFIKPGQRLNIPLRLLKYQPAQARVVSVAGDVRLGGAVATVGMTVPEGARLATGANSSAVVELGDGTQVKLLPQTLADVVSNRDYTMRDASASGSTTWFSGLIRLTQGALDTLAARIERRATPLQIETPTSLVGVRGTQFRVAYEDPATRNARTEVVEGQVRADNPAQQSGADLPGGTGALINPAEREVRVVKLLPAPDLSALPAELNKPQALLPMPVLAGASAFRVQVASDDRFDRIVRDLKVTTASVDLGQLDNASWYTRVRGIDAQGIEGFDSVKLVAIKEPVRWRLTSSTLSLRDGQNTLAWTALLDNGRPLPTPRFSLELASDSAFANVLQRLDAAAPSVLLGALKPGIYYLRLRPLLPDGKTLDAAEYRMDLSANWGETVFDNSFPLVPLAAR
ncbi:MAG: FecR domain-containing protein [Proteobacteria bacterium]|nr:FecR domain-containing protein [Pseudomonadota bacterium]